jgi:hypothetical protein
VASGQVQVRACLSAVAGALVDVPQITLASRT